MTVESVFEKVSGYLADESLMRFLISAFVLCLALFLFAGLLRLISGKRGTAVGAVTATLDILVLYMLVAVVPLGIPEIAKFLPTLPFTEISGGSIEWLPLFTLSRDLLAAQLIDLIIVSFLFGLTEALLPDGKNFFVWLLLRVLTFILVSAALWLIHTLSTSLLPGFVQTYAPMLLLAFLALLLALTVFKWLFGIILGASCGPIAGAVYTFIVSSIVGKQLAKAALTTVMIVLLLVLAAHRNISSVNFGEFPALILFLTVLSPFIARYLVSKLF